ncbi:MAG: response regulator [Bacteriovoracaceae bacterium]
MNKNKNKISVLICEDHRVVRKGLRALLQFEDDIVVVEEASNGLEAIKLAKSFKPMVVLMDLAMPVLNGIEASKYILQDNPQCKIIALTVHSDDGYLEKTMAIGISGYLMKQCASTNLVEAIREIHKGNSFFSPIIKEKLLELKLINSGVRKKIDKIKLSLREVQVIKLIAEGTTNKEIANILSISIKTVDKHRQSIMNKLEVRDTAGLTRYAINRKIIDSSFIKEEK